MADQPKFAIRAGYAKWAIPNTSTVSNDPANEINRAKGEPNKPPAEPGNVAPTVSKNGNIETITDGRTSVKYNPGRDISEGYRMAYKNQHGQFPPCINPDCKSYGRPHPNCLCFGPNSAEQGWEKMAHGGCVGIHQESCEHYATGGEVEANHRFINSPGDSIDHVGAQHGLLHLLTKLGSNGRSDNYHKHLENYVDDSKHGHKTVENNVKNLIGKDKLGIEHNPESRAALKNHLEFLNQNPEKAFDIGGNLGSTMPSHAAVLGARAGNAISYLNAIKPKAMQTSPLDPVIQPSQQVTNQYHRQLDIAQNPNLILQHVQDGTIQSKDLATLQALYPSLHQSIVSKAAEALINAKQNGVAIPRKQKRGLSSLLGQPLDSSMNQMSAQAIMKVNAPSQPPQGQKKTKGASNKAIEQIDKTEDDIATPTQSRLMNKKQ